MRDIIRKILKEQTEVVIPNNKKEYVDKALKMWETNPMSARSFISTFAIDREMAIYIRQKIAEQLSNVPIGKKIWTLGKDFPDSVGVGNYDIEFNIIRMENLFPDYLFDEERYGRINPPIITEDVGVDVKILPSGTVYINVQEDDGEYELKEFSIYDALLDEDFGWEIEGEVRDIIWEYVMSFSPLLNRVRPEIDVHLHSPN